MSATPKNARDSWCHLQETMTMLQLTSAQIGTSMLDGENSVSDLTATLQSIGKSVSKVETLIDTDPAQAKKELSSLKDHIQNGVVACQFHDRVTQRLDHVTASLGKIAELVTDPVHFSELSKWQELQKSVASSFTMESERLMFEQIMMGRSVAEALEIYRHQFSESGDDPDDVELF